MRNKIIITIILFIFSILYIKNAIFFIRENDYLMIEIKNNQEKYNIKPIDAIITKHTMIPGINGRKVNIKKSYNNMKGINVFKESLLVYDEILPNKSIKDIYDKIIISGNTKINEISILTTLNNNYCYTQDLSIKNECIIEKKHTILIYKISSNYLSNIKKNLRNGIVFFLDSINQDELNLVIKYVINNNYKIVEIDTLINNHL
jgi:hypothetical protein